MSSLSRRVVSLERLRGLASRLVTVERALHQLTVAATTTTSMYGPVGHSGNTLAYS